MGMVCHAPTRSGWIDDYKFPIACLIILEKLKKLVEPRTPQRFCMKMLKVMDVVETGRLSYANGGKPVSLNQAKQTN
jgi:hypothetical protein